MDEFGSEFPIAFCLRTHEDETFLKILYKCVQENLGKTMQSDWLMSDSAPQFYNAFVAVTKTQPKPFLCSWHVDKAWREALREKVKDFAVEADVYKRLRTLVEEPDMDEYNRGLDLLLEQLATTEKTKEFYSYFLREWATKKEQWAVCYRVHASINSTRYLEGFHRSFKYKYLGGKANKRVDKCVFSLLKFIRDKTFERAGKLTMAKPTKRQQNIYERRQASLKLSTDLVHKADDDSNYVVKSAGGKCEYNVIVINDTCNESSCYLKCVDCGVCMHTFMCNCPDSLVLNNMCKHIHLVRRFMQSDSESETNDALDGMDVDGNYMEAELEKIADTVQTKTAIDSQHLKEDIKACCKLRL